MTGPHAQTISLIWRHGGTALAVIISLAAISRGGPTERWGAAIIMIGWIATPFVEIRRDSGLDHNVLMVDIAMTTAMIILSLKSRKLWTVFASAFLLMTVATHFAPYLAPGITRYILLTGLGLWGGYALIFALAAGVISHARSHRPPH